MLVALSLACCDKKKAFNSEDAQASVEVRRAQAEEAIVLMDINRAMAGQSSLRGRSTASTTVFGDICGLTVDSSQAEQGIMRLKYDGSDCNGRIRSGTITLTIQDYPAFKLKTAGSVVKIAFDAYKVKKAGKSSLQFDGTATLTNQSGGSWYELVFLNQSSLVQAFTASRLRLTVNDLAVVLYTISRSAAYTCSNNVISCSETGIGTHNNVSNVETWGYTTFQKEFTSCISSEVRWTTVCGPLFPLSGKVSVKEKEKDFELQSVYGADADGNAAVITGSNCPYGFKTSWSFKDDSRSLVFGYDN